MYEASESELQFYDRNAIMSSEIFSWEVMDCIVYFAEIWRETGRGGMRKSKRERTL